MGKYLKLFETESAYSAYTADTANFILPNVSYVIGSTNTYYNPSGSGPVPPPPTPTETMVVCKYNVTDTSSATKLFNYDAGSGSGSDSGREMPFTEMEIDGVEQSEVVNEYTFDTTGEHTVKFTLADSTTMAASAFTFCNNLTSIDVPNSVTSIGDDAFNNCTGLTSVTIGSGVTSIGSNAFAYCYSLTSCTIGSGVTIIGAYAFAYCSGLTSCIIGSGVTNIDYQAFYSCNSLISITIDATTPPTLGISVFYSVGENGTLTVPSDSQSYCDWIGSNLPGSWTIEGVTCGGSGSGSGNGN
jgi:hypothetical protein